jgi:hypothetical protein
MMGTVNERAGEKEANRQYCKRYRPHLIAESLQQVSVDMTHIA